MSIMRIILGIAGIVLITGIVSLFLSMPQLAPPSTSAESEKPGQWITAGKPVPVQDNKPIDYVIGVSISSAEELDDLLTRAENVANRPNPGGAPPGIALILHGPEIQFFNIDNYAANKSIVDRAARLDAFNIIDIRMCETMLDMLDVGPEKIPAFIELVPYGPAEIERLKNEGAIVL